MAPPTAPMALRKLWLRLRGGRSTPTRLGLSVGVGLFVGCLPLYGLHLPLCAGLCWPLKLDVPLAYLAANISNPVLAPFIVFAEVQLGSRLLSGHWVSLSLDAIRSNGVGGFFSQAIVGALVGGGAVSLLGALSVWVIANWWQARRAKQAPVLNVALSTPEQSPAPR
jgi:uncharacterized protein (DUF2062 family)